MPARALAQGAIPLCRSQAGRALNASGDIRYQIPSSPVLPGSNGRLSSCRRFRTRGNQAMHVFCTKAAGSCGCHLYGPVGAANRPRLAPQRRPLLMQCEGLAAFLS